MPHDTRQDTGEDGGPTIGDLAERIQALQAANTTEGRQQRTERKHSTAKEPITARIRRRQGETGVAGGEGPPEGASLETKPMTFQERILRKRQQRAEGEGQGPP